MVVGLGPVVIFALEQSYAMAFDNPLFWLPLMTGIIIGLGGWVQLTFPPKTINGVYGYRTPASKLNQERWDFAQRYSGKLLMKWGAALSATSLLGWVYQPVHGVGVMLGMALLITSVAVVIIQVERALKNRFG